jgi:preprotein translocase SecE subunit
MADVKTPTASNPPAPRGAAGNAGGRKLKDYFETLGYEWRKITWPERKQWKDSTIVVFVFVIVLMFTLGIFDLAVGKAMNIIMGLNR